MSLKHMCVCHQIILKAYSCSLWCCKCYSQSQTHMMHGNSKLCCVSVVFCIAITELGISSHIRPSLCHIKSIAIIYRPCGKWHVRADMSRSYDKTWSKSDDASHVLQIQWSTHLQPPWSYCLQTVSEELCWSPLLGYWKRITNFTLKWRWRRRKMTCFSLMKRKFRG